MNTIIAQHKFILHYLEKLVENIPDEVLYEKQLDGINSAGWILGHIAVESIDVFNFIKEDFEIPNKWIGWFYNNSPKWISQSVELPNKDLLLIKIHQLYGKMANIYENLDSITKNIPCPSVLIGDNLPNVDAWIAHHLTTHIAIHCGNIVVWKKIMKIEVNGY